MKLILGAGRTVFTGWVSTQQEELDVLRRGDFLKYSMEGSLDALLAEHVWEHMTLEEGKEAARNCFAFLKPGGYIRCAVPDANFRNEWYQNMVQVGGPGPVDHPAFSHKIVYDYRTLQSVFEEAGFQVELLEYCDDSGDFHYCYWNEEDGNIGRSFRFDTRNSPEKLGMVSIILDAKKPMIIANSQ